MKCTFDNSSFVKAVTDLSKVVPSRPVLPVLAGIHAQVIDNSLRLLASDGELFLETHIDLAPGSEEGACVLSSDHLLKLVTKLPEGSTSIEVSGSSATIAWASGHSRIPVFDAADYPTVKSPSGGVSVKVAFNYLLSALDGTVYAAAQDDTRPAMSGVFFDFSPDGFHLVATDAKKLAVTSVDASYGDAGSFIIHRKVAGVLRGLLSRECNPHTVVISYDSGLVCFDMLGYTLVSRVITARFPNYRSILPSGGTSVLTVGRKDLMAVVERTAVCADRSSSMVRLDISSGGINIQAQDLGFGTFATDSMLADYSGDAISIGFNARHFADVLANMTCNTVKVTFNGSSRAALFEPSDSESSILEKAVLMPLAISA